jgi:hypothetical protein
MYYPVIRYGSMQKWLVIHKFEESLRIASVPKTPEWVLVIILIDPDIISSVCLLALTTAGCLLRFKIHLSNNV